MDRHQFLAELHRVVEPRTYLEIGVQNGHSLALSRVPSIGIDPEFAIKAELDVDIHLARVASDTFFARDDPLAHLPIPVVDLGFIDGMHLAEYALRDYLSLERFTAPTSVIVMDDMLPRSVEEAARHRVSRAWAGDTYKAAEALRSLRPDLVVLEVDTEPTGVAVVLIPDAAQNGVLSGYDDWLETAVAPDPQDVPPEVLDRSRAQQPEALLASAGWERLRSLRRRGKGSRESIVAGFADVLEPQARSVG